MSNIVHTTLGDIPETDLEITLVEFNEPEVWVVARECRYKGAAHPDKHGEIIRRDVWATVKRGHRAGAQAMGVGVQPQG